MTSPDMAAYAAMRPYSRGFAERLKHLIRAIAS